MRLKSNDIDYHYFPEPNINAIDISNLIDEVGVPELPSEIKNKLIALSVPNNIIEQLINNIDELKAFTYLSNKIKNYAPVIT
jgi:Asp-tRNA(Asn)/Glu-tRNA(Gln) amidotransferase B subunit